MQDTSAVDADAIVRALAGLDARERIVPRGDAWYYVCRFCLSPYANGGTLFPTQTWSEVDHFPSCVWARAVQYRDDMPDAPAAGLVQANGRGTARRAATDVAPRSGTQRARVLWALWDHPDGLLDEEIEALAKLPGHVPRRLELLNTHYVMDSGQERRTSHGKMATVWRLAPRGRGWCERSLASR